jgi:hypothetical protein
MSEDVRQSPPPDEQITEYWERIPEQERYLFGVEVCTGEDFEGHWQVTWWAGEHFRDGTLGRELRRCFKVALGAVPGVTRVHDLRWETWEVSGTPSGEALCRAAAGVLDEFAAWMREAYTSGDD